jgi:hypothetical protein
LRKTQGWGQSVEEFLSHSREVVYARDGRRGKFDVWKFSAATATPGNGKSLISIALASRSADVSRNSDFVENFIVESADFVAWTGFRRDSPRREIRGAGERRESRRLPSRRKRDREPGSKEGRRPFPVSPVRETVVPGRADPGLFAFRKAARGRAGPRASAFLGATARRTPERGPWNKRDVRHQTGAAPCRRPFALGGSGPSSRKIPRTSARRNRWLF